MELTLIGKHSQMMLKNLMRWSLNDANGADGDSLKLTLSSIDVDGLPPKGEQYQVLLGDVERGTYKISSRSFSIQPRSIDITMTVAPLSSKDSTDFRARANGSWHNTTLGQVVVDCVTPHGYHAIVAPELQKIEIESLYRTDESLHSFLRRLAKQYDAISKPVDNDGFIFVPKGKAISATGLDIESIVLSLPRLNEPQSSEFVNVSGELDGRDDFNGVTAFYSQAADGSKRSVQVGSSPFKRIGQEQNSEQEAIQAASAELRKLQRQGRKLSIDAPVMANAFAEGLLVLDKSFPDVAQGKYSIDSLRISGSGRSAKRMALAVTLTGE
ncbi:hypothetical protein [Vibrio splendidus]|uniref:hypothetical protein n=1 Tax=Vibrio splendidus TaxID=29497 RepID=UPI000C818401|nr:hypothetical protein [Vibrio splendidus]PMI49581.1 hypothetical protein BCU42_14400 [Vibrio splendidus]